MKKFQRMVPAVALCSLLLAALSVAPIEAQNCQDLIFRVIQGNSEQAYLGFQPLVMRANQDGHIRAYWRSGSPDPYTLAVQYDIAAKMGFQGSPAQQVRQHLWLNNQNAEQAGRGKINFQAQQPGTTQIAFRITGSKSPAVFQRIPVACRAGVLTVQVQGGQQQQGNYGGQGAPGYNNPPPVPQGQVPFIGGRYTSEFGDMYLNQDGQRVWGTYTSNQGRIEGTFDGQMLRGVWSQAPSYRAPRDAGDIEMRFLNGRFSGVWRYGHGPQSPWEGTWAGSYVGR